jgi:hypothetical protein
MFAERTGVERVFAQADVLEWFPQLRVRGLVLVPKQNLLGARRNAHRAARAAIACPHFID